MPDLRVLLYFYNYCYPSFTNFTALSVSYQEHFLLIQEFCHSCDIFNQNLHFMCYTFLVINNTFIQVRDVAFAVWELHETRCETLYRRNQTNMGGQKRQRVAIRVPDIVHQVFLGH